MQRLKFPLMLLGLAAVLLLPLACATPPRSEQPPAASQPAAGADGDPLRSDQTSNMMAEDAEAFELRPAERPPSRRPPSTDRRRAVDQPRVRP